MANEKKEVVYVPGLLIKSREVTFNSGETSTILKTSVKADELIAFLQEKKNAKGWVTIDIKERREPSDKGYTHTAVLDTWEPTQGGNSQSESKPAQKATPKGTGKKPAAPVVEDDDDNIPF